MRKLALLAALLADPGAAASPLGFLTACRSCAGRRGVRVALGDDGLEAHAYALALLRRRGPGDDDVVDLSLLASHELALAEEEEEAEIWALPAAKASELSACVGARCRDAAASLAWLRANATACRASAEARPRAAAATGTCADEFLIRELSADACRMELVSAAAEEECPPGPLLRASVAVAAMVQDGSPMDAAPFLLLGLGAVAACALPRQFFGGCTTCLTCCCRPRPAMQYPIATYPIYNSPMRPRADS